MKCFHHLMNIIINCHIKGLILYFGLLILIIIITINLNIFSKDEIRKLPIPRLIDKFINDYKLI